MKGLVRMLWGRTGLLSRQGEVQENRSWEQITYRKEGAWEPHVSVNLANSFHYSNDRLAPHCPPPQQSRRQSPSHSDPGCRAGCPASYGARGQPEAQLLETQGLLETQATPVALCITNTWKLKPTRRTYLFQGTFVHRWPRRAYRNV